MVFKYNPQHHVITKLKSGKQGLVGMIWDKSNKIIKVYKFSSIMNKIATHEYKIMTSLATMNKISPFFTKCYELVNLPVNDDFEETDNPFELNTKYHYTLDICISEYVENARKFTSFLRHSKQVSDNIVSSLIKQILVGLLMAQNNINFTHYDLHSENILVQKCSYDDVFVWYDQKTGVPYIIPSLGYIPRIIDYGFSYSDGLKDTSITSPLDFMKEGYFSVHPDEYADFRILLISILEDLYHYRPNGYLFVYLRRIVKKLFHDANINWESGWFIDNKSCAEKFIYENMVSNEQYKKYFESPTIEEHFYSILGCLQLMMNTPLNTDPLPEKSMNELFDEFMFGFKEFYKHFVKLEHLFEDNNKQEDVYESNPDMGLYIIRTSIDCVLKTKEDYLDKTTSRNAVRTFQNLLYDAIRANKKLNIPKINYEKYMVSIHVMATAFQSLLYREYIYRSKYVQNQYATIGVETPNDIYEIVNHYLTIPYHFTQETRFILMNEMDGISKLYRLNKEQCLQLNENNETSSDLLYTFLNEMEPYDITKNKTIQQILYSKEQCIDSPNQKVNMKNWSPSDDSESDDSDDEEYNVKYNWAIDSISAQVDKKPIEYYGETSEDEEEKTKSDC
jgi:hypothetical protein